jgi:hypothetical protein
VQRYGSGTIPGQKRRKTIRMAGLLFALACMTAALAPVDENGLPPGSGAPVPAPPAAPFAVFETPDALNKRLAQATRSELRKEFGTDDLAVIKARMARADELEKQEEERKKAEMTETDRLKTEKLEAEQKAARAEAERDQERLQRHIAGECAAKGIKAVDYASFLIEKATDALPAGQQLDVAKFLDEQLADETKKAAFGIAVPAPTQVPDPATTVPKPGETPPPPPKPGETTAPIDAMNMSPDAWQKHKQQYGLI